MSDDTTPESDGMARDRLARQVGAMRALIRDAIRDLDERRDDGMCPMFRVKEARISLARALEESE